MGTKAVAGAGSIPLASALVAIGLWACGSAPPQEIVLSMQAVASSILAYVAIYFMPHNGGGR